MGAAFTSVLSPAHASGEDGAAFATAQAAEVQKEVEKILSKDKGIASMSQLGLPTAEQSVQSLAGLKEQLDAVKVQAAQIIDRGDLMKGLNPKTGCPSQLFHKGGNSRGDCSSKPAQSTLFPQGEEALAPENNNRILVFVSLSMPEASLKSLGQAAEHHNAILVMRGLYEDSFVKTANKLKDLGIGVDINPELFETHHITAVPTFVAFQSGKPAWCLKGNVTLAFAAKKFEEKLAEEQKS